MDVTPIPVFHGEDLINGYRIKNFAYITDVSKIPAKSFGLLKNLKVLMIDALRYKPHKTHLTVDEAVRLAEKINPERTYFTHMGHHIDYGEIKKKIKKAGNFEPARDGLVIEV